MREKVVLPKFSIPGQSSSWTVRALWALGGLVAVQMAVFALLVWKQGAQSSAFASPPTAPAAAPVAALPQPTAAVAAAEVPAAPVAAPTETEDGAASAQASDDSDKPAPRRSAKAGRGARRSHHGMARSSKLAKASPLPSSKSSGKSKSKQPDALDDLLKRFK